MNSVFAPFLVGLGFAILPPEAILMLTALSYTASMVALLPIKCTIAETLPEMTKWGERSVMASSSYSRIGNY